MYDGFLIPMFYGTLGETTKKKITDAKNAHTFMMVFSQLVNMALDYRYRFDNLPKTLYERVIKQSLLFYGNVTLFNLDGVPVALPSAPNGQAVDLYGNTGKSWIFSRNGKMNFEVPLNYEYDAVVTQANTLGIQAGKIAEVSVDGQKHTVSNGVIIWENKARVPFIWTVIYFAERIADTYRTLDLDRRWLKRPFIPRCEESEGASFDESLKKFMNNEDFSVSLKARSIDKTDIFSVDMPPEIVTKVTQLIEWYYSQFKQLCGISANSQVDKKGENLISGEIDVDDQFIDLTTESITRDMQEQIDLYNQLAGENIKVVDIRAEKEDEAEEEIKEETKDDGEEENTFGNAE